MSHIILILIHAISGGVIILTFTYLQLRMLAYVSIGIAVLFLVLYLLRKPQPAPQVTKPLQTHPPAKEEPIPLGRVRIYFGSQTGTAAKLSEQLAEEGTEQGFSPEVIDLKDAKPSHFHSINEVSLFLLSNTGEGDPPENTAKFLKVLKGKEQLEGGDIPWERMNFGIFGLGNTQYEHFNKIGRDFDALLQKNGAKRIYRLGLGDDNCSLEDDFTEWRKDLWKTLKEFRAKNPLKDIASEDKAQRKLSSDQSGETHAFLSKIEPTLANYRLFFKKGKEEEYPWQEEDLDFKTKASLKAETGLVKGLRQLRQDEKDGSTLQFEVELPGQPEYPTAGNIALYAKNPPSIIQEVIQYFAIDPSSLGNKIGLIKMKEDKKIKLNFVPGTIQTLLEDSIDLQGKLSKSVLKKVAKFPSNNPEYFNQNSSKTTKEFQRITSEEEWYYLIRVIREFAVKLSFEDFLQLSDSMAPRLFTLASHCQTIRNPVVAASLTPRGLISSYFLTKPQAIKAELRKSTFTSLAQWKKVIMMGAGTGLAPFRGYLQEKQYNMQLKSEGKGGAVPIVSLFFGCKHQNGDFIYKEEILSWQKKGVIDRLHLAFSRDSGQKVYIQDLLAKEEAELKELGHCEETAIYICGSLPMGKAIVDLLTASLGAEKIKAMEEKGRIVKELW